MPQPPRGIGKGLGALLGGSDLSGLRQPVGYVNKEIVTPQTAAGHRGNADIVRVPVDMIEPNPFQPRTNFDEDALEELADSIRSLGLIQPITVRRKGTDKYQIISGERRYRACRRAALTEIPAYILEPTDQGMLEMAIVENVQRADLDPIEVALSYQRLIDECNLTQEQMASRVGKKRVSITNYLRLLRLPAKIQHDIKVGLISVGHAKVLLSVDDPKYQEILCDAVVRSGMSVRELEAKIARDLKPEASRKAVRRNEALPEAHRQVLEKIGSVMGGSNVKVSRNESGKGSITIRFSSDSEVESLLALLSGK
ncbi:MAG: ParB/RepB/Spo0J family partition protein [Bacteroidales bacterium]|nr:ParB/RepB/Spo0J family partition protein [Bacteroidales bacterium]